MAESCELRGYDVQLARDHSLLLEERLRGSSSQGPSNFAGLLGSHTNQVNEYAFLAPPDEDDSAQHGQRPLQRWVSNIGKVVPVGVQLEPRKLQAQMGGPSAQQDAAAAPQHAQQPAHAAAAAKQARLSGQFAAPQEGGAAAAAAAAAAQQQRQPASPPGPVQAAPVPGNPLKIRLKITNGLRLGGGRESSAEKRTPPPAGVAAAAAAQLLQSVRQLGAGLEPPLSPIPAGWAEVVSGSAQTVAEAWREGAAAAAPAPRTSPLAVAAGPPSASAGCLPSPFEASHDQAAAAGKQPSAAAAGARPAAGAGAGVAANARQAQQPPPPQQGPAQAGSGAGADARQQQQPQPKVRRQPSPPAPAAAAPAAAAAAGFKRPAPAAAAAAVTHGAAAPAGAGEPAAAAPAQKKQRSAATVAGVNPGAGASVGATAGATDAVGGSETASPGLHTPSVFPDGSAALSAAATAPQLHGSSASHPLARAHSSNLGPAPAAPPAQQAQQQPAAAAAAAAAPAGKRQQQEQQQSAIPPAAAGPAAPQQQSAVPAWAAEALQGRSDDSRLGVVAALLPGVLEPAASGDLPSSRTVQALQAEGKKLKKFAEKKMRDGRPTHISSMFLCQSCVKFLTVAATMEAHPAKFSRESTSSMYSQTASLLDSCAHNAGRAEGPRMITTAISLLAQRLAAVARLRAAFCLRAEGLQQVAAFRGALEKASGETYQRPSPTDSNTSTSISVPLDPSGGAAKLPPPAGGVGGSRGGTPPGGRARSQQAAAAAAASAGVSGRGAAAAAAAALTPPLPPAEAALVGMPKAVLERQLLAAQHSQQVLTALSCFNKSSERLREFMGQAAAQNSVHGLKVAASALLLSADAGVGSASAVLSFAKDALDAVMQMQ